ncbi:hypothetical protein SAMN04487947_0431 [Halogeometricum rufum]|uniref:Uncharacterized protein n=1 Tax=Halogeometricum rufum TaxID=553469 RepID=A0A1I6G1Z3_9EURY|nr:MULTISPECIES: hypothetical protein [Halogeometricum]MUV57218.1 hypothetical protein [Halogeometricum sp. CBA1124]SFR36198.1 hypothetical protein SAMN04487947_0431 [Halogeometricum rufum]
MALVEDLRAHVTKDDLSGNEVFGHLLVMAEFVLLVAMVFPASGHTAGLLPADIEFAISSAAIVAYGALNCSLLLTALALGETS